MYVYIYKLYKLYIHTYIYIETCIEEATEMAAKCLENKMYFE